MHLTIRFESANLLHGNVREKIFLTHLAPAKIECYDGYKIIESNVPGYDNSYLVGVSQVSNMLHVLCGLPPVPKYRESFFEINKELYDLASNAYIKYDTYLEKGYKGFYKGGQFSQLSKPSLDSHRKEKTLFEINGVRQVIDGYWSWDYLERSLKKEPWEKYIGYISRRLALPYSEIISKYTFPEAIDKLSETWNDDEAVATYEAWKKENKNSYNKSLFYFAFGIKEGKGKSNADGNGSYKGTTPIINTKGIGYKLTLNGSIYIPDVSDEIIDAIEDGEMVATLLDGGLAYVEDISEWGYNEEMLNKLYMPISQDLKNEVDD